MICLNALIFFVRTSLACGRPGEKVSITHSGGDVKNQASMPLWLKAAWLVIALLVAQPSFATIIEYEFGTSTGISGSFSYDDTAAGAAQPGGVNPGGAWYTAISFVVDGVSYASPRIGIYNDNFGLFDQIVVVGPLGGFGLPVLELAADTSLFTTTALSEANGRSLSDFNLLAIITTTNGNTDLSSLVAVPEPATLSVLAVAFAAAGVARRRHRKFQS